MASMGAQVLGWILALLGWVGVFVVCFLPMWRVTAFLGNNIVTSQIIWEGIWMTCVVQSTGEMYCEIYDSTLSLTPEMQVARALLPVAIVTGFTGIITAIISAKCTKFRIEERTKVRALLASGLVLVITGILCIIPVSWTASSIITDFYDPLLPDSDRRELGGGLYLGWAAGLFLVLGGGLLCSSCPPKENYSASVMYNPVRMSLPFCESDSLPGNTERSLTPSKTYI